MNQSLPAELHLQLIMLRPQCPQILLIELHGCPALPPQGFDLSSSHCPRFSLSQISSRNTPSPQTKHCLLTNTQPLEQPLASGSSDVSSKTVMRLR